MSIRLRKWKGPNGEIKQAWVVDYTDADRKRHLRTFTEKHHARVFHTRLDVKALDARLDERLRIDDSAWHENVLSRLDQIIKLLDRNTKPKRRSKRR